jgi:6-phosphogluconolactonase (cycloisomerase 2 family)
MKRMVRGIGLALAGLAVAMAASNGPITLDWNKGGHLYVLLKNGSVSVLDEVTKRKLATIPSLFAMEPVEIYSARLKGRDYVFVSGFSGRSGAVYQYTADGKPYARFETPDQAASFDIDSARHLLYVASPVTNVVYAIGIDQKVASAKRVAFIREAEAVGPLIFDEGRNRVLVGDSGRGVLYEVDVTTGSYQQIASDLGRPISLEIGAAFRTLYVADYKSGRIHVFRLDNGVFKRAEAITTGLRRLSGVSLGPDDTLFVADGQGAYQWSLKTKKLSPFAY